jgi:catechol 2,3-dioxygenase
MEERGHHCMILKKAAQPSVGVLGFKVWSEEDLDKAEIWFRSRDLPTSWIERPFMGRVLSTRDPFGVPLEFYARMDRLEPIHQKYKLYRGVKPLRIDHFNLLFLECRRERQILRTTSVSASPSTPRMRSGRSWAAWMHRKGGVHDIAFTNGTGPRLHHTAFWVPTPLNIIDLLDLMSTTGYLSNIERGPGRHGISNAFFLYIRDPGRPPHRDLLFRLPDHRSGSRTDQVGPQGSAAPDPLGCARAAELV